VNSKTPENMGTIWFDHHPVKYLGCLFEKQGAQLTFVKITGLL
jgi:hypothetical protein